MKKIFSVFLVITICLVVICTSRLNVFAEQSQLDMILEFAKSKIGSTEYAGYCQAFVYQCYKAGGIDNGSASSAIAAWKKYGVSTSKDIPIGACVYFDENVGSVYGHVGLYIGNNQMIHSRASTGKVEQSSMTWYFDNCYLGWGWQGGVQPSSKPICDYYRLTAPDGFQVLRENYDTSAPAILDIPVGANTYVCITKYSPNGTWGYTTYNGKSGWIKLYYAEKHTTHSYGSWTTVTSPTCTATGSQKRSCVCGVTETQTTSALGHNYSSSWTTDVAATCTKAGSKSHHCTRCSAKTDVTAISATGHSYGTWTTTNSATCTAAGSQKRTCSKCSTTETQTISALGHNYSSTWTTDTAPTCTSAGSKSHHCTRCNAKSDVTAIAAKGHSYSAWTTTKAPTCTLAGDQKRTCSTCKIVETKGISALGHSYSSSWTTDTAPSCTTAGSKSHHCTKCSAKTDITAITATGHAWTEWKVTVNATEENTGTKTRTCKNSGCTVKETAAIAKLPSAGHTHSFGEWYTEKAATCTADGTLKRKCSGCDAFESKTISATGHSFGQWTTSKPATEKAEGILERKCANCNAKETESIPRLPQIVTEAPVTPAPIPAPTEAPTQNVGIPEVTAEPSVTSPILSDAPITTSEATTEATAVPTELPTSNNPENNDDTDNDSGTKIALIAVSSIAILLLVALVVIVLKKKS
ncbi:MAG: C40 family peptidase [Clostridia bacterium]|nr:C40 family peptidase [Clostridia bacterium]